MVIILDFLCKNLIYEILNLKQTLNMCFVVNDTLLNAPKVVLIFHGVDTFATILLNGHEVGETSNMFLRYTFDVTKYLEVSILLFHTIIYIYMFLFIYICFY